MKFLRIEKTILDNFNSQNEIEKNYLNAQKHNRSDFLKHRSALNSSVLKISAEMAAINAKLISINKKNGRKSSNSRVYLKANCRK